MIDVGTRWYWNGRHWTVVDRATRTTRDYRRATMILLVPDETPGKPRKPKPVDWIEEARIESKLVAA
jgi:hypothetical protein